MRILGIDPGLKATGYGIIDFEKGHIETLKLIEAGTIEPKRSDLLQNKIKKVYQNLDSLIVQFQPDVMILEKLYSHHKYLTTASILGHVRGVICLLSAHRNLKLIEESVKRIRKAIVGQGNASKNQTQSVVEHILKLDGNKLSEDASDALALALGYVYILRNPLKKEI